MAKPNDCCTCAQGTTRKDCEAHRTAKEHRDATGHDVIVPPPSWERSPYCCDCTWPVVS